MTVRWKPLILLSALFLLVGLMGVVAITYALLPGRSSDLLALARADRKAGRFEKSQIQFRRALQVDPKNAAIYRELAEMYSDWAGAVPAERPKLRPLRMTALSDATKADKKDVVSRRMLMDEMLRGDEVDGAAHWAQEVLALEAKDADAHFALAADALLSEPRRPTEARPHVEALEAAEPEGVRAAWARAESASQAGDEEALAVALKRVRPKLAADASTTSPQLPLTRLRLLRLDVEATADPALLPARVAAFRDEARRLAASDDLLASRIARIGRMVESVQRHIAAASARDASAKAKLADLSPMLDGLSEALYQKAVDPKATPDPRIYLAYAQHLLFRERRADCLAIVDRALQSPLAAADVWAETTMQVREVGIKAALSDPKDPKRIGRATPHIQALKEAKSARYQALGHLFQGIIDLERSGLAAEAGGDLPKDGKVDGAARSSALTSLRRATEGLPDVSTARALYGVALLLSGEPALGRQHLNEALRLGNLEPRYQVWAAWSMLQAGYPEEAQPIVEALTRAVEAGKLGPELAGSLHLLNGEVHQARHTRADLQLAKSEYELAIKAGQPLSSALQLRMAQVDVLLGKTAEGQRKIDEAGGPAAAQLAILLLREQGKADAARSRLAESRKKYPESDELVTLEAAFLAQEKKPEEADRVLAAFLAGNPTHTEVALLRARLLASELKKPEEARKLLAGLCEKAETSAPLIQLALLDLADGRYEAVATTIARVRGRWKESASGDLLDAQLAMARNNPPEALKFIAAALKKDPTNKVALFWKAQLEEKVGASADAAKIYEEIARDKPVKEVDPGLSLAVAAEWALATQALENQDFDGAIARFEGIVKSGETGGNVARTARWRVVQARAAKGDWPAARAEMAKLLSDKATPDRERIQAANLYRLNKDYKSATEQLKIVLAEDPGNSQAVAVAAFLLADEKKPEDAARLVRAAMAKKVQPPSLYLMLAAIENLSGPRETALPRALAVIDEGMKAHPDAVEVVRAKSRVTRLATGDPDKAIAVVEERAKSDKSGTFRRLLADVYREENRLPQAEEIIRSLQKENPDDLRLMTALVRLVADEAMAAGSKGDRAREKALNDETARLLASFRARKPTDLTLAEAECDLLARRGEMARAVAVTEEIDKIDPNSPVGPLLRAKIQAAKGDTEGVAAAYEQAASRAPRRLDIRMALGQSSLAVGRADEAVKQAEFVLEGDRDRPDAVVLKARALSTAPGSAEQRTRNRNKAVALLKEALARKPKDPSPLVHLLAEIQYRSGQRAEAVATLQAALQAAPNDENGVAMLAQILTEPRDGRPAPAGDMKQATELAQSVGSTDKRGNLCLALAVGFHKAGQVELALPWAERAAGKLDLPVVHLNFGDILLSKAEGMSDPTSARDLFSKAVEQYDLVLKAQANSIEAINNKAWILHRHLNRNDDALALAEGLSKRVDPSTLPPEFHDTLGAIYEAAGRKADAESTYERGLKQSPDHPVLNYHMGRLLAADPTRKGRASSYLEKALEGKARLGSAMSGEAETLLKGLGG